MSYKINKQTLELLSKLSKLTLTSEQKKQYLQQFEEIVAYISKIKEIITKDIKPVFNTAGLKNIFKDPNGPKTTFTQAQSIANANKQQNNYFVIPRILRK